MYNNNLLLLLRLCFTHLYTYINVLFIIVIKHTVYYKLHGILYTYPFYCHKLFGHFSKQPHRGAGRHYPAHIIDLFVVANVNLYSVNRGVRLKKIKGDNVKIQSVYTACKIKRGLPYL